MFDLSGKSLRGYEFHEQIGAGGYGAVYRASQPAVNRDVAIKVILPQHANKEEFAARFESEARVVAKLEHPHIIPLHDYWRDPDEGAFLVMRYLSGGSLRKRIMERGGLPLDEVTAILEQIAGALAAAHSNGVIHRDLKPDNVLLDQQGNAYLSDFGIAKNLADEVNMTRTDDVVGSPAYLSPEQIRSETVTPLSDIYSLGIVLYELLTGEHPFIEAGQLMLVMKHLQDPLPIIYKKRPDLPNFLDDVLQKATAKKTENRYPDVHTLLADFKAVTRFAEPVSPFDFGKPAPELEPLGSATEGETPTVQPPPDLGGLNTTSDMPNPYEPESERAQPVSVGTGAGHSATGNHTAGHKKPPPFQTDNLRTGVQQRDPRIVTPMVAPLGTEGLPRAVTTEARNRLRMLQNVRAFWVDGVLETVLLGQNPIDLEMTGMQTAEVNSPWDIMVGISGTSSMTTMPPGTRLIDAYARLNGKVLILGGPGSGKTTALLLLARDLLDRADRDEATSMPVVLTLTNWPRTRKPIAEWLVDELNDKYGAPRHVAEGWVSNDQLTLLLDSFDEVPLSYRPELIAALNQFQAEHGFTDFVVCSREAEYEAAETSLRVNGAVRVRPLSVDQVDRFLESLGPDMYAVRVMLSEDYALRELARSPLFLSIVTTAYRGLKPEEIPSYENTESRRAHIYDLYVRRVFARRAGDERYTRKQTLEYLRWLARRMITRSGDVFLIEQMQPSLLLLQERKRWTTLVRGIAVGGLALTFGLPALLIPLLTDVGNFWFAPLLAAVGALMGTIFTSRSWKNPVGHVAVAIAYGLAWGVGLGMSYGPGPAIGLGVGIALSVGFALNTIVRTVLNDSHINPSKVDVTDVLNVSLERMNPLVGLFGAIVGGTLIIAFTLALAGAEATAGRFLLGLVGGSAVVAACFYVVSGLVSIVAEARTRPNQGIFNSLNNANRLWLISVLPVVGLGLLGIAPATTLATGVAYALGGLGAFTVPFWFAFGGYNVIQHAMIRQVLTGSGEIPRALADFLDYAASLVLLRKVGGGYSFLVPNLLEYFAQMDDDRLKKLERDPR